MRRRRAAKAIAPKRTPTPGGSAEIHFHYCAPLAMVASHPQWRYRIATFRYEARLREASRASLSTAKTFAMQQH
jgi:hypothetical protein